ncbi:MAG: hypothetical protein ABIH18_08730 [Candidatus Omnitrophota bacterium]
MKIKTAVIIFLSAVIFMFSGISYTLGQGGTYQIEEGPLNQGVEHIDIGPGASVMVPKGAKIDNKDGVLKVEGPASFSGRKFVDVEKRLDELEKNQIELKKEIEKISVIVTELQKNIPLSKK